MRRERVPVEAHGGAGIGGSTQEAEGSGGPDQSHTDSSEAEAAAGGTRCSRRKRRWVGRQDERPSLDAECEGGGGWGVL